MYGCASAHDQGRFQWYNPTAVTVVKERRVVAFDKDNNSKKVVVDRRVYVPHHDTGLYSHEYL